MTTALLIVLWIAGIASEGDDLPGAGTETGRR